MKKGKITSSDGRVLLNKITIKVLKDGASYKYFGAIQSDGTKHHEASEKDTKNKTEWWKYSNKNKYMSNFITKILFCLSRLDRDKIKANR